MEVEWNPEKAKANLTKHGVDFADAMLALEDEFAKTIDDPDAVDEARLISVGMDPHGRLLVTIFTYRGEAIRIISARKATKAERRDYEEAR